MYSDAPEKISASLMSFFSHVSLNAIMSAEDESTIQLRLSYLFRTLLILVYKTVRLLSLEKTAGKVANSGQEIHSATFWEADDLSGNLLGWHQLCMACDLFF